MANHILHINSSARTDGSQSRALSEKLVQRLSDHATQITHRDVGTKPPPAVTEDWVNANFTTAENRSDEQTATLALSDELIGEIEAADTLVLAVPIYNFGVPAAFKAWIDQIARAGKTFRYTENGPVGLLENKKAFVVITSGGTGSGSEIDFATPYVRHVLGFIGINQVEVIAADQLMIDAEGTLKAANDAIETIAA
ncbi:MAG: NAD(P)H-dependent oxidoreductase [Pseudomonadota bacterium]